MWYPNNAGRRVCHPAAPGASEAAASGQPVGPWSLLGGCGQRPCGAEGACAGA